MSKINEFEFFNDLLLKKVDVKPMSKLLVNRRAWIIRDLLDRPLRQKDIRELWARRGEVQYKEYEKLRHAGKGKFIEAPIETSNIINGKIWKPKRLKDGIGISKGELSRIFNGDFKNHHIGLIEEGLVEKIFIDGKEGVRLVENQEALYQILNEFKNPRLPKLFRTQLNRVLMNSEYAEKLITLDLVAEIEFETDPLDKKEVNFIYMIIKISPSALFTVLKKLRIQRHWKELNPPESEKKDFIMGLQFKLYIDTNNQKITDTKLAFYPLPVQVDFKIETSIKTGKEEFKYANTLQRCSIEFLSKEEQKKERKKIENLFYGKFDKEQEKLLKPLMESIDVPFDLETSPLVYEK